MPFFSHNYKGLHMCENTSGFSRSGNLTQMNSSSDKVRQGSSSVSLGFNTGVGLLSLGVTSEQIHITEVDVLIWFHYVKGKSSQYLKNNADSLSIEIVFSNGQYARYNQGGHDDQIHGWACLKASGTNPDYESNAGSMDYTQLVTTIRLRFDINSSNTGTGQQPLFTDYWHSGNTINCINIQYPTITLETPEDLSELVEYNEAQALGVLSVKGDLYTLNCGLDIQGHFFFEDKSIINEQFSEDVEHPWIVRNGASLRLGTNSTGYPLDGCYLECISDKKTSLTIEENGYLFLYRSKIQHWSLVQLGDDQVTPSTRNIIIKKSQFVNCDNVELKKQNSDLDEVRFISATGTALRIYALATLNQLEVILNENGLECNIDGVEVRNSTIVDNTTNDIIVNNDISFVDCEIDI